MNNILIPIICLICISFTACSTSQTYQNPRNPTRAYSTGIISALFPNTTQAINRWNYNKGTYQTYRKSPCYCSPQNQQEYREFLAWKYNNSQNCRQSQNDYAQFLQNKSDYYYQNEGYPTNYSNTNRSQQTRFIKYNGYNAQYKTPLPTRSQVNADIEAANISMDKLPWESEPEYRTRLQQIQTAAQARANRYNKLLNEIQQ